MRKHLKLISAVMCIAFAAMLVSLCVMLCFHPVHVCCENDCRVCVRLHAAEKIIENGKTALIAIISIWLFAVMLGTFERLIVYSADSLVSLKVKLTD